MKQSKSVAPQDILPALCLAKDALSAQPRAYSATALERIRRALLELMRKGHPVSAPFELLRISVFLERKLNAPLAAKQLIQLVEGPKTSPLSTQDQFVF